MSLRTNTQFILLLVIMACAYSVESFQVSPITTFSRTTCKSTSLSMSANVDQDLDLDALDATERMLIEKKRGIVQRLGKTVKKDGLDGIRDIVWATYFATNYVIGALVILAVAGFGANMAGYGYFFDDHGVLVFDTLVHIRQEHFFATEAARLMSR